MTDRLRYRYFVLWFALAFAGGLFSVIGSAGASQSLQDRPDGSARHHAAPTSSPAGSVESLERILPGRAQLLREGSRLMQVRGVFTDRNHRFTILRDDPDLPAYTVFVLPSRHLSEIEQVLATSPPDSRVVFELSGRVTVYRSENYLLITSPPRVVSDRPPPAPVDAAGETATLPENEAAEASGPPRPSTQRGARDIMEQLERESGPLPRTMPLSGERAEEATDSPAAYREELLPSGTILLQRRGRIFRDAGGTWTFVFDADVSGLADPPMRLMPCLLLERIELFARRNDPGQAVLISGQVFEYDGRNYLLPTEFLTPVERTILHP